MFRVQVQLIHHKPSSFCSPLPFPAPIPPGKGKHQRDTPIPTQVLLSFPFLPLLPALGQEHNLLFRIRVMRRFPVKVTRSYRPPRCRGSYKSIPIFPCCCLGRELVVFFSLLQTRLGMSCVAWLLQRMLFQRTMLARLSQDLEQERMRCLLNTLQEHNTECLFLGHLLFTEP